MIQPVKPRISAAAFVIGEKSQSKFSALVNRIVVQVPQQRMDEFRDLLQISPEPSQQNLLRIDAMQNPAILSNLNRFAINGKRLLFRDKSLNVFKKLGELLAELKTAKADNDVIDPLNTLKLSGELFNKTDSKSADSFANVLKQKGREETFDMREMERLTQQRCTTADVVSNNAKLMLKQIQDTANQYFGVVKPQRFLYGFENPTASKQYFGAPPFETRYSVSFDLTGEEKDKFVKLFKEKGIPRENVLTSANRLFVKYHKNFENQEESCFLLGDNYQLSVNKENLPVFDAAIEALRKIGNSEKVLIQDKHNPLVDMYVDIKTANNTWIHRKDESILQKDDSRQDPQYIKKMALSLAKKMQDAIVEYFNI